MLKPEEVAGGLDINKEYVGIKKPQSESVTDWLHNKPSNIFLSGDYTGLNKQYAISATRDSPIKTTYM